MSFMSMPSKFLLRLGASVSTSELSVGELLPALAIWVGWVFGWTWLSSALADATPLVVLIETNDLIFSVVGC
jgi:hypothetical protein